MGFYVSRSTQSGRKTKQNEKKQQQQQLIFRLFCICRTPEQCPSVVSLLAESYNPHVRYGAAMALGIACAGTGLREAIALLEPMVKFDPVNFVRQGALVSVTASLIIIIN